MKNILTIFKKELTRFFGDKRMAFTAILLPGVLIYLVYSLMGTFVMEGTQADATLRPIVAITELPQSLKLPLEQLCDLTYAENVDEAQALVEAEEVNVALLFPENFDAEVAAYDTTAGDAPLIELYFNASDANSVASYDILCAILDNYESGMANKFDIAKIDTSSEEQASGQIFASILPMLLMTLLYSGCNSVATESIAGEKERGTIATLLITPVKRSHIALGKILALSLIALLSGGSSILGTVLSLPKMLGSAVSGSIYGIREYFLLSAVVLSTVLLMVTAISLISTFAKSVKEAGTMTSPLMVLVMLLGVIGLAGLVSDGHLALYLIPLYNSSQAMASILSFGEAGIPVLLTALSNLTCAFVGVWVLTKLFQSERILYKV